MRKNKILVRKLEGKRYHIGDLGTDDRITLKKDLKNII
jgi:hypothetical protein